LYSNEGDNQEAIFYYDKAIKLNPNFSTAYYDRGLVYIKLRDRQAATSDFQKAAELFQQQGKPFFSQQALAKITYLQKTLSVVEENNITLYEGSALNTTYQLPGKISIEIEVIESDSLPRMFQVWMAFSQGLYGQGLFEGVINQNNVLELSGIVENLNSGSFFKTDMHIEFLANETIRGTYSVYAGVLSLQGRPQNGEFTASKVKRVSEEILLESPENPEVYLKRGDAHQSQGDYTEAIADYTEAIRLRSDYVEAYFQRGIAHALQGESQKAIEDFNEVLNIKPDLWIAYYIRGLVRIDMKDYPTAIADFDQVFLNVQEIVGIGVEIEINSQTRVPTILSVTDNLPAYQGGIKVGDQVIEIDEQPTANLNLEEVVDLLRGQKGTQVTLKIIRPGNGEFEVTMTRELVVNIQLAKVYYNRGLARLELEDKQGAREDLQKAADLYKQQNNIEMYQTALEKLRELQ
ncbi:MAG: tetratricopeptide repeat protein, partial [Symploca sp. SIO2E6]|nr:tetratricopeptide repeat protein [Symploca sp. SIO2E6]